MKFVLKLDVPDNSARGLEIDRVYPAWPDARAATAAAIQQLEKRRRLLAADEAEVARLPEEVQAGHVAPSVLESAIRRREMTALMVPADEAAVRNAEAHERRSHAAAIEALRAEVKRRYVPLQAIADQLGGVLDALRDAESAIDQELVRQQPITMGMVDGLVWRSCVRDEAVLDQWQVVANQPARPA